MKKIFVFIVLFLLTGFIGDPNSAAGYENSIKRGVEALKRKCSSPDIRVLLENETWDYCYIKDEIELVSIKTIKGDALYFEAFGIMNDELVYAFESIEKNYKNPDMSIMWSAEYIIRDNQVSIISSLGHGKTESDEWQPEAILTQWNEKKYIYNTLKLIRKPS